ncbi:nuclear transport factor 2 family protein [Streptomyces sp. YKOK-J1]
MPAPTKPLPHGLPQAHCAYLGFTLTHMTGYVQPKAAQLAQMRPGRFVYHSIQAPASRR